MGFDSLSISPNAKINETFQAGHDAEIECIAALSKDKISVTNRQATVSVPVTERIFIEGHTDGFTYYEGDYVGVEIKSMGEKEWEKWKVHGWDSPGLVQKYKWQISSYMVATGYQFILVIWVREGADAGSYVVTLVEEPFYTLEDLRLRVLHIEAAARQDKLPLTCDIPSFPCPFYYLHDEVDTEYVDDPAISTLAREYKEVAETERLAGIKKKELRAGLRKLLGDIKKCELESGIKVSFYEQKNPPSLDREKMIEDGIDIDKYLTSTKSERIKVTLPKTNDATTPESS